MHMTMKQFKEKDLIIKGSIDSINYLKSNVDKNKDKKENSSIMIVENKEKSLFNV